MCKAARALAILLAAAGAAACGAGARPLPAAVPAPAALVPLSIVPQPRQVRLTGGAFTWPVRARIVAGGAGARTVAEQLRAYLGQNGVVALVTSAAASSGEIVLRASPGADARLGDEGYALRVSASGLVLQARTARGLFYALQTLQQISARSRGRLVSRAVTVVDWPAYRWRGIHLDVARHFFAVPVVERYIDLAAHYKLNVFHWHLTDDQAWRLRSARYPALTEGAPSYSPADVRAVVAYAARRYVTVVPELEMPAHATAVLRAYPALACAGGTLCTSGAGLDFARAVLREAMAAFPSPYLHTGGDEVPAAALRRQPAFTRELERELAARGRRLAGWNEIASPELSRGAVVTVWTDRRRVAEIARGGNDVVAAAGALYFDAAQGDAAQEPPATRHMSTLEQVYEYPVTPPGLTPRAAAHVLGAQANLWTEHIATPDRLFAMALPRELALAEVVWTPRHVKRWDGFLARLPAQLAWLEAHGYPFRIPNVSFELSGGPLAFTAIPGRVQAVDAWSAQPRVTVKLSVPLTGAVVRYTTDGSLPTPSSPAYRGPFAVRAGATPVVVQAAAYRRGRHGAISACVVRLDTPRARRARRGASATWASLVSP